MSKLGVEFSKNGGVKINGRHYPLSGWRGVILSIALAPAFLTIAFSMLVVFFSMLVVFAGIILSTPAMIIAKLLYD